MGRPWDYPRWRRVLMQVLMWVVLAGSLGLAQLLARGRMNDVGKVARMGPFEVRLPEEFQLDASGPNSDLVAREIMGGHRVLYITVAPMSDASQVVSPRFETPLPIEFSRLHVMGVMQVQPQVNGSGDTSTLLIATAPLPRLRKMIVIGLELGADEVSAADQALLRRVAGGIHWADNEGGKSPATRRSDRGASREPSDIPQSLREFSEHQ